MKLKVIKDCFYISDGNVNDNQYLSKEELLESFPHLLVKGDIWETDKDDPELFICVEGEWKGEYNEGWWEYEVLKEFFEIM
jgi:hypothetical protein